MTTRIVFNYNTETCTKTIISDNKITEKWVVKCKPKKTKKEYFIPEDVWRYIKEFVMHKPETFTMINNAYKYHMEYEYNRILKNPNQWTKQTFKKQKHYNTLDGLVKYLCYQDWLTNGSYESGAYAEFSKAYLLTQQIAKNEKKIDELQEQTYSNMSN